jgi:hypothetical protein
MRDPAQRFLLRKAIKTLGSASPEHDTVVHVAHQDRRQLQHHRMLTQPLIGLVNGRLSAFTPSHIAGPCKFRADVQRYRPQGQTVLSAVQWPAVNTAFQRELSPAGALLVTDRVLVLISEGNASPLHSGAIITYFPVARLADFHVGHHDRFGFLALQVHAAHGGEKLEIMFPPGCEQPVLRGMEHVLVPANNYI